MTLQGVPYASHAVVGREVVELWEDLPLPVDTIAHPAITLPLSSSCLPLRTVRCIRSLRIPRPT